MQIIKRLYSKNPIKFVTYCTGIFLSLMLIIITICIINKFGIGGQINENEVRLNIVITGSMEPTIVINGLVYVEHANIKDLELNDIVKYNSHLGYPVIHRVVAINKEKEFIITKGDNNKEADAVPVTDNEIVGRVVEIHNEYASVIGAILGKADITDWGNTLKRAIIGIIVLLAVIGIIIFTILYTFDLIVTNMFWKFRQKDMQESLNWMNDQLDTREFNRIVDSYKIKCKEYHGIKKLILMMKFRKLYDDLTEEEKKAKKTFKTKNKLLEYMN